MPVTHRVRRRVRRLAIAAILLTGLSGPRVLAEVNLPPGFEVVTFAVNDFGCTNADINDCGEIAFAQLQAIGGNHADVFVYDNGHITRITDNNDRDVFPFINNRGQILWGRGIRNHGVTQLVLYDDGRETIIDEFKKSFNGWSLNNLGHVAWSRSQRWRRCPKKENIFLWNGIASSQLTFDGDVSNVQVRLNDAGAMVWVRALFCDNPWNSEIVLRDQQGLQTLESPGSQNQVPRISNNGNIVWKSDNFSMMMRRGAVFRLPFTGAVSDLNDSDRICRVEFDHVTREKQPIVYDLNSSEYQRYLIASGLGSVATGSINEHGECVWIWYEDPPNSNWRGGVLYLRRQRFGDVDLDGVVGLLDYARFSRKLEGPLLKLRLCDDRFLDLDYDGDLDMADYARFQNSYQREGD
ncbi:MAG: hypothetical protein FLDDKLPJ_01297 [Phycisphaerae bacterium]|nr:hypothetical protein [Phycisphaerae bacterium]